MVDEIQESPIEVNAERNLRAKSLRSFLKRYGVARSVRLSLSGFDEQGEVVDMPLYATSLLPGRAAARRAGD